jgi:hypothetical protein
MALSVSLIVIVRVCKSHGRTPSRDGREREGRIIFAKTYELFEGHLLAAEKVRHGLHGVCILVMLRGSYPCCGR